MKRFPVGKYVLRFLLYGVLLYVGIYIGTTFIEALK